MKTIQAGEFKAKCLELMNKVNEQHVSYIITKHGKPVAKLVPIENSVKSAYGCLKDTAYIKGDIVAPIGDEWEADK